MKVTLNEATVAQPVDGADVLCDRCEEGVLREQTIQTAFWRGTGLVVVRNIPAMVCSLCGEEYVADRTAIGLDQMRGAGFTSNGSAERMIVPVINYVDPGSRE